MTHAANTTPPADADRRLGVGAEGEGARDAEVRGHGLHPQALGGPVDDAAQLGFGGAQGHHLLGLAVMLDQVGPLA